MQREEIQFFAGNELAIPLYEALIDRIEHQWPWVVRKVQKTQISFYDQHLFGCASFLRVRPKKALQSPYLVLTLGLPYRLLSPRVVVTTRAIPWPMDKPYLVDGSDSGG